MQTTTKQNLYGDIFLNNGITIEKQLSNEKYAENGENIQDFFVWKIEKYLQTH